MHRGRCAWNSFTILSAALVTFILPKITSYTVISHSIPGRPVSEIAFTIFFAVLALARGPTIAVGVLPLGQKVSVETGLPSGRRGVPTAIFASSSAGRRWRQLLACLCAARVRRRLLVGVGLALGLRRRLALDRGHDLVDEVDR